jgi:hypothetical protein
VALLLTWWTELKKQSVTKYGGKEAWTEDQIQFTLKNIGPMTFVQVAEHIGKTPDAVRNWVRRYDDVRLGR